MTQIPVTLRIWLKTFKIKGFPWNSHVITSKKRISSMQKVRGGQNLSDKKFLCFRGWSLVKGGGVFFGSGGLRFEGGQKLSAQSEGGGQNLSAQS